MTEPDPLRAVIEPVVAAAGFDLEEITVAAAGRRRQVRVVIDSDAGVDLDAAAEVSAALSVRLDEGVADEVFGEAAYILEVTSPGIGRPLTLPRHFRRATGRIVSITLVDGTAVTGRVRRVDDDDLVLLWGPDGLRQRTVALADIRRAVVEVEFTPVPSAVAALLAEDAGVDNGRDTDDTEVAEDSAGGRDAG